jgi:glycerol-1-phosphate dehydrogenase [NAD(P)+]
MTSRLVSPEFGHHLVEELDKESLGRYVVYSQELPWKLFGDRFVSPPQQVTQVERMDIGTLDSLVGTLQDCDSIVGFGGGLSIDTAKYVAWKTKKRFIAIPTVISADASACRAIAIRDNWRVRYIGDKMPDRLLVDFSIVQSAPSFLNRGGICDILSCYTALEDWQIAHIDTGEALDQVTVKRAELLLSRLFSHEEEIRSVSEVGIEFIVRGYLEEVDICERFGSSRPEEGSEHFFAYNVEFLKRKPFLHGGIVSLGVVAMTILQDRDPRDVISFLTGCGIAWKPKDMNLNQAEIVDAIETLYKYCEQERFYYTVINRKKPNKERAVGISQILNS